MTVILVTHSMEDVAKYVDRILVMKRKSGMDEETSKVFSGIRIWRNASGSSQVTYE